MNETAQEITTEMAISVEHDDVAIFKLVLSVEQQWKKRTATTGMKDCEGIQ